MTDLRERFEQLDQVGVPDVWNRAERIGARPPMTFPTPPSRRVASGIVALVVVAVAGYLVVRAFRPELVPVSPIDEPEAIEAVITQTVDTGRQYPEAIAIGEGAIWVATRDGGEPGGDLVRIDPVTGDIEARIAMPSLPQLEFGRGGITIGLGSVWVLGYESRPDEGRCCDGDVTLRRVDPATNEVAETIPVGPGVGDSDVWADETGVWVLTFSEGENEMWLYRFDPTTLEPVTRIDVPADWSQTVFAAGGSIWVFGSTSGAAPAEALFRIDPATNLIAEVVELGGSDLFSAEPSGDRLWFYRGGLRAIDVRTGEEVLSPVRGLPAESLFRMVADGGGGVWVFGVSDQGEPGGVWHVNADGVVDARSGEDPGDQAAGIAAAFDPGTNSVWIVHYEDTVSKLQITPTQP